VTTPNPDSDDALCGEILAEAQREAEEVVRRAQSEAEALLAGAQAQADQAQQEQLRRACAEGARRKELVLATVPVEAGRRRSERIEALLQDIYEQARQRLDARQGFDYRSTVIALAVEAMSRMSGEAFVVRLSPADHLALGDGAIQEITRRVGRARISVTLADGPAITGGGMVLEDAQGHQVWDNHLAARLRRLWPELRQQIAVRTLLATGPAAKGGGT
jgi:vacuolar-type H+-ATPase subunit E/Vma4